MVNVKNLVLGIGIIIVFALVLWQGIEAFYPSPKYDDFCKTKAAPEAVPLKPGAYCNISAQMQKDEQQCYSQNGIPVYNYDKNGCQTSVQKCDLCNKDLEKAQDEHAKKAFYISLIVGLIVLIIGYSILTIEPVGSALIGSGIWSFFWGTVVNWRNLSSIWRFLLLLVALILIIYITIRLNTKKKIAGKNTKDNIKTETKENKKEISRYH